uniref:Thioesterase n=1 Tax=uncultured bacterium esnapd17 TaxID=1366598 RepID=S5TN51_9BACT|nr:thioesterase [uncultured bacterium esnapd17]
MTAPVLQPTTWPDTRFALPRPAVRMFCFPFAGGSAAFYADWAGDFVSTVELVPIQLPARGALMAQPPARSITEVADAIAPVIAESSVPVALYGHSMGAIIAFETARRLQEVGKPVRHLFVSGRPGPRIKRPLEPVSDLPRPEFVEMLRDYGAADQEILEHDELLDLLIPMMRADFHMIESYTYPPGPPLTCDVSAWAGADDTEAPLSVMQRWGDETTGTFTAEELPGGHFFLSEHREHIVRAVHERLG